MKQLYLFASLVGLVHQLSAQTPQPVVNMEFAGDLTTGNPLIVASSGIIDYVDDRESHASCAVRIPPYQAIGAGYRNDTLLNLVGNKAHTISIWFKTNTPSFQLFSADNITIGFGQSTLSGTYGYAYQNIPNLYEEANQKKWHHIACVATTDSFVVYINNVLVNKIKRTTLAAKNTSFILGNKAGSELSVDQLRIYNVSLTKEEIATLYTQKALCPLVTSLGGETHIAAAYLEHQGDHVLLRHVPKDVFQAQLMNSNGQLVADLQVSATEVSIPISSFASGLYLLKLHSSQGAMTYKFVK